MAWSKIYLRYTTDWARLNPSRLEYTPLGQGGLMFTKCLIGEMIITVNANSTQKTCFIVPFNYNYSVPYWRPTVPLISDVLHRHRAIISVLFQSLILPRLNFYVCTFCCFTHPIKCWRKFIVWIFHYTDMKEGITWPWGYEMVQVKIPLEV